MQQLNGNRLEHAILQQIDLAQRQSRCVLNAVSKPTILLLVWPTKFSGFLWLNQTSTLST